MRAVLDSSTALASVLPESLKPKAIQFLEEFRHGLHDLLAPDIFPIETLNGLAKAERQKRIKQAYSLWQGIMTDAPVLHPHMPLLARAYEISDETKSAVYDCVYVALGELEGCDVVSTDDKLIKNMQGRYTFVIHLKDI